MSSTDLDQATGGSRPAGTSAPAPRSLRRWRGLDLRSRSQRLTVGLGLLAVLPALLALPELFSRPYTPGGDRTLLELGARRVTHAVVELGQYSRNGWFHPGPAIYYLLAGPYLITGRNSIGILLAALIINTLAILLITVTVRRQAGMVAAIGSLAVLLVVLRAMPATILSDPWNPYLPILGIALLTVLAWRAAAGRHQLIPLLPALASLCVQAHIGYLLPSLAVLGLTVVLLVLRRQRPRIGMWRWIAWGAVLLLIWLPPVWQQLTGRPGNLSAIRRYFSERNTTQSWSASWHLVETEIGRLPAYVLHVHARPNYVLPPFYPAWTAAITLVVFGIVVVLAALRRERTVLELAAFTVAISLAALVAVKHVTGLLMAYIVQWASLSGALAWITVAVGVGTFLSRASLPDVDRAVLFRRTSVVLGTACAVLAIAMSVLLGPAAGRSRPENEPDARPVAAQLRHWLAGKPPGQVGVSYLWCTQPSFLCTLPAGHAVIGQLIRHGVPTRSQDFESWNWDPVLAQSHVPVRYPLLLGFGHGGSPTPPRPWHLVASGGSLVVYARN